MDEETKTQENSIVQRAKNPKTQLKIGGRVGALMPQSIDEAAMLASNICFSGMVPDSYLAYINGNKNSGIDQKATRAKVMIGILKGMEVGLPPISAINSIAIVNNRPSLWGDGVLALIQNSDKYDGHTEEMVGDYMTDEWGAVCTIYRKGIDKPFVSTFTWKQAKKAGLSGRNIWQKYPERMLQMRARGFAVRNGFSDVLSGISIAEEQRDIEETKAPDINENVQLDEFTQQALLEKDESPEVTIEIESSEVITTIKEPIETVIETKQANTMSEIEEQYTNQQELV